MVQDAKVIVLFNLHYSKELKEEIIAVYKQIENQKPSKKKIKEGLKAFALSEEHILDCIEKVEKKKRQN